MQNNASVTFYCSYKYRMNSLFLQKKKKMLVFIGGITAAALHHRLTGMLQKPIF